MAGSCSPDESQLRALQAQYQAEGAAAAASKVQELVEDVAALQVWVGFLGERGAGVSTLVRALAGQPQRVADPWVYFREVPQPVLEPVPYAHPTFPQLILHDLPGFSAGESPSAYLARLGDLGRYSCLVVVVGAGGPLGLGETQRQVLRAVWQKARVLLLVRSKVDMDRHTAKRQLLSKYNPTKQLALIRKELAEALAKEKVDPKKTFLVSGLEMEKYDFAHLEEYLEEELLGLTRNHKARLEDATFVSHKKIKEVHELCRSSSLSEVPSIIHAALEDPTGIRLDVAVVGEAGCKKSSLIHILRGVGCGDPGTALIRVAETPRKAGPYEFPTIPQSYLWDLVSGGAVEEDIQPLDLSRYDLFLLVSSEHCKDTHSCLARAIASVGKEAFLIRLKMDEDTEAQTGPRKELQEEGHASPTETSKKDSIGHPPRVFVFSFLPGQPCGLPLLQEALQNGSPGWKRQSLKRAIPALVSCLVREEARMLMRDAWGKALHACLSCLESPPLAAAENLLVTIAGFCQELGLDKASLERTARVTGKAASVLQAEIQSRFAQPLTPDSLLGLVTRPPSLGSWAWSYVPYFGRGTKTEAQVSFAATYRMLQRAVVELSEDAERVLCRSLLED